MDRKQLADSVKARVSVVDVVGRYVQLSRAGNNHKGLCPFHNEATPSFLVSDDKGIYKCFVCGEGGDAISFVSKMEGISYSEALARLAENAGVDQKIVRQLHRTNAANNFEKEFEILKFAQGFYQYYLLNTEEGKSALEYLASRGITHDVIRQFGIGLAPRDGNLLVKALEANRLSFEVAKSVGLIGQREQGDYYSQFRSRIMFQVTNEQGKVIGFSGRTYIATDHDQAKYINSPESRIFQKSQIVYNLHEARKTARTTGKLFIFEGFLDVIASHQAGFAEVVATMGTALTMDHAKILSRHCREAILVFDGDKAGLGATSKAIPILLAAGLKVSVAPMPNGLDPDDYIKQNGTEKFASLIKNAIGAMDFQYEYLKQGINLATTDGQIEFERRLMAFSNLLPDRFLGQALIRKWNNEKHQYNQKQFQQSQHTRNQPSGFYRKLQGESVTHINQPTIPVRNMFESVEEKLIFYMIKDKLVFEIVSQQIGTSFNIDAHRKIVQAIEAYYFKNEMIDQEEFLNFIEPTNAHVVRNIIEYGSKNWPEGWSKEAIVDLINKVQKEAKDLAYAERKKMFYNASGEDQASLMIAGLAERSRVD